MKSVVLLIFIISCSALFCSDYEWKFTHLSSEKVLPASVNRVSCLDQNHAVVSRTTYSYPYSRCIEKTDDYGQTWDTLFYEDLNYNSWEIYKYVITDIKYLDKDNILAICGFNNFLQSTDGGKSWIDTSYFDDSFAYNEINSYDSLVIVASATDKFMGISNDLGKTWRLQAINIELNQERQYDDTIIYTPKMRNDTLYTLVHLRHRVPFKSQLELLTDNLFMYSTDKGKNWQKMFKIDDLGLSINYVIDDTYFYTQSVDYTFDTVLVYKPDGTGLDTTLSPTPHWQMVKINRHNSKMDVITDSVSFTCGSITNMNKFDDYLFISTFFQSFYSSDYGNTWVKEVWNSNNKTAGMINDFDRVSMSKGFMVGSGKFATLEPATSVSEHNPLTSEIAVYPNPAGKDDEITIDIKANESGKYTLQLTALDGSESNIKQTETLAAGLNRVSLNLSSELASGIYILSIYKEGQFVAAQKVVISG